MIRFATEADEKRAMVVIKQNYLHKGWHAKIYQSKEKTYTEPNTVRKGTDKNSAEDPSRIELNISNKNKITRSDKRRKGAAEDKTCYACNFTEH